MADFNNSFESFVGDIPLLNDIQQKYVMVFGKNANFLGKIRPEAILFKNDLVDMGLPSGTLWATKNVGAATETDYGWYFSWGNTDMHMQGAGYDFSDATYATTTGSTLSGDIQLENDAANANLGSGWRIPTSSQFAELFDTSYIKFINASGTDISSQTDKRTTLNGVVGLYIESKINSKRLFFPAAGFYLGTTLRLPGSRGYYWSSSIDDSSTARSLKYDDISVNPRSGNNRRFGFTLRPVM